MDVEGEWKNEQTVARLWVGYMWKGPIVTIVLFTTHVPVFFWPSRHNFRDIELIFCILS